MISLFGPKKLKPLWTYAPGDVIWRLLFGGKGKIAGESRDPEKKTVTFFCLDEKTGTPLWHGLVLDEQWWSGIEAIQGNTVILHGFEKPDLPGHKKIVVLDAETGKELWRNESLTFWFAYRDQVVGYEQRFEKRVGQVLDLGSGKILQTYQEGIEALFPLRQLARDEDQQEGMAFPEPLKTADLERVVVSTLVKETGSEDGLGTLEGVVREGYLLVTYYRSQSGSPPEAPRFENRFAVIDRRTGKVIYRETLQRDAAAPLPDSFFLKDRVVFFVKDQRVLTAVPVPRDPQE